MPRPNVPLGIQANDTSAANRAGGIGNTPSANIDSGPDDGIDLLGMISNLIGPGGAGEAPLIEAPVSLGGNQVPQKAFVSDDEIGMPDFTDVSVLSNPLAPRPTDPKPGTDIQSLDPAINVETIADSRPLKPVPAASPSIEADVEAIINAVEPEVVPVSSSIINTVEPLGTASVPTGENADMEALTIGATTGENIAPNDVYPPYDPTNTQSALDALLEKLVKPRGTIDRPAENPGVELVPDISAMDNPIEFDKQFLSPEQMDIGGQEQDRFLEALRQITLDIPNVIQGTDQRGAPGPSLEEMLALMSRADPESSNLDLDSFQNSNTGTTVQPGRKITPAKAAPFTIAAKQPNESAAK